MQNKSIQKIHAIKWKLIVLKWFAENDEPKHVNENVMVSNSIGKHFHNEKIEFETQIHGADMMLHKLTVISHK